MRPKERPILFTGEMVCAILDGRKTQTRRIVYRNGYVPAPGLDLAKINGFMERCPYGQPGDRLWVRETWKPHCEGPISEEFPLGTCVKYKADGALIKPERWTTEQGFWCEAHENETRWRPAIHMPRWASRLTLEVTGIHVERLQEISEGDAIAEGFAPCADSNPGNGGVFDWYHKLWDSINAKNYPWSLNPWVWVLEFRKL